ncbi:MAG: NUDIX hydrolase [bacterium]
MEQTSHITDHLVIGLNAVLAAIENGRPLVLVTRQAQDYWALPYGAFDPAKHRTFELGLRDFVSTQTNMSIGYVEQLYTFGDRGREAPLARIAGGEENDRIVSVGYLALAAAPEPILRDDTAWRNWYDYFPWEDWRKGQPRILPETIFPALQEWAESANNADIKLQRQSRINLVFGLASHGWEEERVLERYELMYEAGLVVEAQQDGHKQTLNVETGKLMLSDHRRILATAIGRLRGKLRYRPVIFQMLPKRFTLLELQQAVEAILGFSLHKQNFRRGIENSGLVEKTGQMSTASIGRPAALFQSTIGKSKASLQDRSIQGLTLPRLKMS